MGRTNKAEPGAAWGKASQIINSKRLAWTLWLLGMLGVIPLVLLLPSILPPNKLTMPMWLLSLVQFLQSGILVAGCVLIGVKLAPKIDLHAPGLENLVSNRSFFLAFQPQVRPGLIGAVLVGMLLCFMYYFIPPDLSSTPLNHPTLLMLVVKVLYGGITEEIIARWGVMTFILWSCWHFIQRNQASPSRVFVWVAILFSSLLFAVGHLPVAFRLVEHLSFYMVSFILFGNLVAGGIFGYLYQRVGLESAIIAHAGAHIIASLVVL